MKRKFSQSSNPKPRENVSRFKTSSKFQPRQSAALKAKIGSIEHKFMTNSVNEQTISQSVTCTGISLDPTNGIIIPIQGVESNQREGRTIMVDQIFIQGQVRFPAVEDIADTPLGELVRISLVQDTQTNAALLTTSDVYTNSTGTIFGNVHASRNPNGTKRFKVWKEKMIVKPQVSTSQNGTDKFSSQSAIVPFNFYVKFKNPIRIQFNATNGGTIADVVDNSFHILAIAGGESVGAGVSTRLDCTLTYNARSRFYG